MCSIIFGMRIVIKRFCSVSDWRFGNLNPLQSSSELFWVKWKVVLFVKGVNATYVVSLFLQVLQLATTATHETINLAHQNHWIDRRRYNAAVGTQSARCPRLSRTHLMVTHPTISTCDSVTGSVLDTTQPSHYLIKQNAALFAVKVTTSVITTLWTLVTLPRQDAWATRLSP